MILCCVEMPQTVDVTRFCKTQYLIHYLFP